MLNIPEIEARAAACEPEPWRGEGDKPDGGDAAFFAHAREDIPALTALVRDLAGALKLQLRFHLPECICCSCETARESLAKVQL